jgi:RNA polymerase sigma-70 factor (ECF subfamily)
MVARDVVAEELVQEAALRLLQAESLPDEDGLVRAWLFRVVSNLAIDHLRRHSTWRELVLIETRERAATDASFLSYSSGLRGSPEMHAIAREHLAVCFACTLRNLPPNHAAAILLREVHEFSISEVARIMAASAVQVKNWLQSGRRTLEDRYGHTCALVAKQGVCHQCVELDGFFNGQSRDPLAQTDRSLDARFTLMRETREKALGPWHRRMMRLVDDLLGGVR